MGTLAGRDAGSSNARVTRSACILAWGVALITGANGCGGSSPVGPTTTTLPAAVATSVTAQPTIRRMGPQEPTRATFELRGSVTFQDTGGNGFQLTSLHVELMDGSGGVASQEMALDVALSPGGSVTHALPDRVSVPLGLEPTRLRVSARGVDRDGNVRRTGTAEAQVSLADGGIPVGIGGGEVTFNAAGDIADCANSGAQATARLLDSLPGDILTLGDHVYPEGSRQAFSTCYASTWGRHWARTRPNPGNHDWGEQNGTPYFEYFGASAGPRTGYHSYNMGAWHVLSLNSNVGAGVTSPQFQWVQADLAANPSRCTMAIWHHARFSSGTNGNSKEMQQIWWLLDNNGVDLVLSAHEHAYERFAPQNHEGMASPTGMRLLVAGTGGGALTGTGVVQPNSQVRGSAFGVLRMTLRPDSYSWAFVPAAGSTFTDSGTDVCQ